MERRDQAFEFEASDAVARAIYIGEDKVNEEANLDQVGITGEGVVSDEE